MSTSRPYTFAGLPKVTRSQVALLESATTYLSQRPSADNFVPELAALLGREMRVTVAFGEATVRTLGRDAILPMLPQVGYFAVVGLSPGEHKVLLDIDPTLAAWCVERLLGGTTQKPQTARVARAPTDMEAGVLSYLLLQIIAYFSTGLQSGQELALVLDRVVGTSELLMEAAPSDANYVVVGTRVQMGSTLGGVRLLLPEAVMQAHFGAPVADSHADAATLAHMRKRLVALPEQTLLGHVIGAHLDLLPADMTNLEPGDIIVLESHKLSLKEGNLSGAVTVVMGTGKHGDLDARLFMEDDGARLEITKLNDRHEMPGGAMAEDTDDNLPETQGLLREIDAQVAVELGRIRLNTAQVVRLRAGQVLHLPRGANDPVDLVVGGKLFAKGELIEVDGELGVRLTQLTGSP